MPAAFSDASTGEDGVSPATASVGAGLPTEPTEAGDVCQIGVDHAGLQSELDSACRERDALRAQLAKAIGSVGPLLAQLDEARHDAAALQLQLNEAVRIGEALSAGLRDRIAVEEAMRASTMWRITGPLRNLVDGARRGRRRRES